MNRWMAMFVAVAVAIPVLAQEKPAAADGKKEQAAPGKVMLKQMPMEDITVSGKVMKDDKGAFSLKTDDGSQVALSKGDTDFAPYAGKTVTIVGKGFSHMKTTPSGEKQKKIHVRTVTSITEGAGAAPAPAPKADAVTSNAPAAAK